MAATGAAGLSLVTSETIDGHQTSDAIEYPVPPTPPAGVWETPEGFEITLPSGATFGHEALGGHERSHGWEAIKDLPRRT